MKPHCLFGNTQGIKRIVRVIDGCGRKQTKHLGKLIWMGITNSNTEEQRKGKNDGRMTG